MVLKALSISVVTLFIGGCFGGGGGGGGSSASISQFVKYSEVPAGVRIQVTNAQTQEATWTQDVQGGVVGAIQSVSAPSAVGFTGTLDETYDNSNTVTKASYSTSEGTLISFGTGDSIGVWAQNPNISFLSSQDGADYIRYSCL